jgi:hypothetical protein
MSQPSVERVIGRLVTDEALRRRFTQNPRGAVDELVESGIELNPCEQRAIAALDPQVLQWFADRLDPRIQKSDLRCGCE